MPDAVLKKMAPTSRAPPGRTDLQLDGVHAALNGMHLEHTSAMQYADVLRHYLDSRFLRF